MFMRKLIVESIFFFLVCALVFVWWVNIEFVIVFEERLCLIKGFFFPIYLNESIWLKLKAVKSDARILTKLKRSSCTCLTYN